MPKLKLPKPATASAEAPSGASSASLVDDGLQEAEFALRLARLCQRARNDGLRVSRVEAVLKAQLKLVRSTPREKGDKGKPAAGTALSHRAQESERKGKRKGSAAANNKSQPPAVESVAQEEDEEQKETVTVELPRSVVALLADKAEELGLKERTIMATRLSDAEEAPRLMQGTSAETAIHVSAASDQASPAAAIDPAQRRVEQRIEEEWAELLLRHRGPSSMGALDLGEEADEEEEAVEEEADEEAAERRAAATASLREALEALDLEAVEDAIAQGADVDAELDPSGRTALHAAAMKGAPPRLLLCVGPWGREPMCINAACTLCGPAALSWSGAGRPPFAHTHSSIDLIANCPHPSPVLPFPYPFPA